jgi:hypothetical protein
VRSPLPWIPVATPSRLAVACILASAPRPVGTGRIVRDTVSGAMETKPLCHQGDCTQTAAFLCMDCRQRYCGEHFLHASFVGAGLSAPTVVAICQACLAQTIEAQQGQGQTLSQWRKAG